MIVEIPYLNEEKPAPSRIVLDTTKMEKSICEERRNNVRDGHCSPKESQAEGEFVVLVEVGEIQDDLGKLLVE
jgi:hypothetical protein